MSFFPLATHSKNGKTLHVIMTHLINEAELSNKWAL